MTDVDSPERTRYLLMKCLDYNADDNECNELRARINRLIETQQLFIKLDYAEIGRLRDIQVKLTAAIGSLLSCCELNMDDMEPETFVVIESVMRVLEAAGAKAP